MDVQTPLFILLSTINRALADQGVNPSLVSDADKLLMAASYVEAASEREKMFLTKQLPEDKSRDAVLDPAPDPA